MVEELRNGDFRDLGVNTIRGRANLVLAKSRACWVEQPHKGRKILSFATLFCLTSVILQ